MATTYRAAMFAISTALILHGCSIVDRGNDYQVSRSNSKKLVTPGANLKTEDKLSIPNENDIAIYKKNGQDFEAPKIPGVFFSLADMKVTWDSERMWIETSANTSKLQPLVADFFAEHLDEEKPLAINTSKRIETLPIEFVKQSTLASIWSSITRLYPKKVVYDVEFRETNKGTSIGVRYKTVQKNKSGDIVSSDWMNPNVDERLYRVALNLWTNLARQTTKRTNTLSSENAIPTKDLWLSDDGQFAIRLPIKSTANDFIELLNTGEMHLISEKPLQIAFIKTSEIPKIGDLKTLTIPSGSGEELVLGKIRRRNLDDLTWEQLTYDVSLMQRSNGVFVTIDTSASKYPDVVSYHAMQKLLNF